MSKIVDYSRWIDRLLAQNQEIGARRSQAACDLMDRIVGRMRLLQDEYNIPERDIAIIDYLARNPMALIIPDANVRHAFNTAKHIMSLT